DGGKTWKKRTSDDGLPKGELGRMGLAIAPSNPNRVYALVESKKNALYRSEDGGFTWKKINDKEEIGNRPFYYYDIFVDPKNENRLYSIHSMVSRTEDGGNSFRIIVPYSGVHPDHHAFWIHPEDPYFLIDGNDGGMNISRDMGENWRFVENLPLAQYYHVNVDNEMPYNVYGGMQDNGSWRGPAYVWRAGGIRNSYWEELFFGDGFDVMPDPSDANVGYAMSQGGNLGRYDFKTGNTRFIKPVHPDGIPLRFNWNAAIAQNPFNPASIYYGSQFVHKSNDRGETWEVISPDLTTNDPEKQKQLESGGLTYDVTQAENHTTIVAIAPSPVDENTIWVGTDDGNLQLTRDGGKTWKNQSKKLKEVPEGSWIPQIHPSNKNADEAYVIINNYRRDDWTPYVYRTKNGGKSWERIVDQDDVWGYALSIVQDLIEPKLLFLGTEFGLYVSIDEGENWTQWKHGYPTVSTMDMKIHPREHDLVIATFGRAAYVLDDIRPLRAMASNGSKVLDEPLYAFETPEAVLVDTRQAAGIRFAADAIFSGENRQTGARISFSVNPDALKETKDGQGKEDEDSEEKSGRGKSASSDSVNMQILNAEGEVIRNLAFKPEKGVNRVIWRLDRKGERLGGGNRSGRGGGAGREPSGGPVMPGEYTAKLTYGGHEATTKIKVILDPRLEGDLTNLTAYYDLNTERIKYIGLIKKAVDQLNEAKKTVGEVDKLLAGKDDEAVKALKKQGKTMKDSAQKILDLIMGPEGKQGIYRDPFILSSQLYGMQSYLEPSLNPATQTQEIVMKQFKDQ
ncbi:MAG: hypothetical protein KDD63_12120, partial [Bacteroidetes bacterium]|nr:hypothetical protein [Bacteroidota bacterium]